LHLFTPSRVTPHRGRTAAEGLGKRTGQPFGRLDSGTIPPQYRGGPRDLLGKGPHPREQRTGDRHHHVRRVLPPCAQVSIACAPADLCRPPRVLARRGERFPAAWQMPTHVGRLARGPRPVDEGPAGLGIPGLREASLVLALTTRRFRRRQAHRLHAWSGVRNAGQVAACGNGGDRHSTRPATESLERVNHRAKPPGRDRCMACLVKPLEPFGVFGDRADICWADAGLSWGGTDDLAEPAWVSRAPGGPPGIADILPPQKRVQAQRGRLEIVERLFTRAAQVTHGVVCDRWDIDRRELPRAQQPRQLDRVTPVGLHAVAGLLGMRAGATTQQTWPVFVRSGSRQSPQGPASSLKTRGWACACRGRTH
jgi:hypothetical protein